MAAKSYVTPVQLGKKLGIRPQVIFNWIRKQGAPCKQLGGKWYVDEAEINEWRTSKQVNREERKARTKAKRSKIGNTRLTQEEQQALLTFKPQHVLHPCPNPSCEDKQQEFLCDIVYTGDDIDNYVYARCSNCGLNFRATPPGVLNNHWARRLLLGEEPLFVPCFDVECVNECTVKYPLTPVTDEELAAMEAKRDAEDAELYEDEESDDDE